ncbi:4Fe-4S binding protein [Draconibacterium sp.]|nr:4Fe-4S binding protein [Draconibacterium sp.]
MKERKKGICKSSKKRELLTGIVLNQLQKQKDMSIKSINGCIGCGTCVKTCPTDVIRLNPKTKKAEIRYPADCQICHLCRMYCPVDAITISPEKSIPVIVSWG